MKMLSCTCRRIVFLTHYFRSICLETNRSLLALLMLSSTFGSYAAPQRMEENLSLALPVVGAYQLRLLTPALLELTLVTTKAPDPAVLSEWDFVNASNQLLAPQPDRFQVQADGKILEVTAVGFKRRPLYAPLKIRDLRIGNYLYLQLAQPVSDGAFVRVLNPDATLWCSETDYSVQADPLRFSPAIHVHQEGYQPLWTKKAMIGYYLGSLGELTIPATSFCLVRVETSEVVFQGQLAARIDTGYTYTETPYQKVMEADFSEFETPGEYRLWVP
ncbi:MAG TPA: cellulase N-terminal Ig-like domain-containing protein, partial [Candidatus Paceibacterota bacterium]|nr:cellulase N-terminal Ig-like domain-containing protein [Verrucomicrobiota bacterium]HRY50034.1 cellulase N-terminal Ig-like domain-containing protein [Candidatus Paceibacterota bacterium]